MVAADFLDVGGPLLVAADRIGAQTEQLCAALVELGLKAGHLSQLGGADRGEVLGVGEEDEPVVADVLMKVDGPLGGVGLEVGGSVAQAQAIKDALSVSV